MQRKLSNLDLKHLMHIATTIIAEVNVLLTTDDKLISLAKKNKNIIKIKVENPIEFIKRLLKN